MTSYKALSRRWPGETEGNHNIPSTIIASLCKYNEMRGHS